MSYYTERERAQRKMKCICACLTRQQLADLLDMARRWGGDEVMDIYDLSCGPDDYCATPGQPAPIPGLPAPIPGLPVPQPGCPGGDCGSTTPGSQFPSGVINGQPALPPAMTSQDRPPAWFCTPAVGTIVKYLNTVAGVTSVPGVVLGPKTLNFPYKVWEAACEGRVPWTTVKWAFCEVIKTAAQLGLLTPALPGAVVVLGAVKALCPETATQGGAPTEQNQIKQLIQQKQQDPNKLLEKVLNPAALPQVSTALGALLNAQPSITGNPAVDMLTAIVGSGKESVLTHVFAELGLPIGPQGQIQPDNGQQFSPNELGMLAAGLIGGMIGWVDVNFG